LLIEIILKGARVCMFGSSVNELCEVCSDLDLSLFLLTSRFPVVQSCYNTQNISNLLQTNNNPSNSPNIKPIQPNLIKSINEKVKQNHMNKVSSNASTATNTNNINLDLLSNSDNSLLEPGQVIERLGIVLQRSNKYSDILSLPKARVPIVKFYCPSTNLHCDIGVNNFLAVKNSILIKHYMNIDSRARDLCLIIKYWYMKQPRQHVSIVSIILLTFVEYIGEL
jgi:hypothetical protein